MASSGSKKRSAPGTLPNLPTLSNSQAQPTQRFPAQWPVPDISNSTATYSDANVYNNLNTFDNSQLLQSAPQFDPVGQVSSLDSSSNQLELARRPMNNQINNQLITTTPRKYEDFLDNSWAQYANGSDQPNLDLQQQQPQQQYANGTDSIEALEQRADKASKDRKQIPPFVQKLWSYLDKSENIDLIRWSERGDSFVVLDEDEFAKRLIPELFKHNNYASFVRQLNMYGFHKKVGLSDNSMKASEKKNKSPSEYSNPYFRRGHPKLLWLIEKPKTGPVKKGAKKIKMGDGDGGSDEETDIMGSTNFMDGTHYPMQQHQKAISAAPEQANTTLQKRDMSIVQRQLNEIQNQQQQISTTINRLRNDHNELFTQAMRFQTQHDKHESSINAILTFLATVYRNNVLDNQGLNMGQLFANVGAQDQQQPQQRGNVVDMTDSYQPDQSSPAQGGNISPLRRPQRLLMAPPVNGNSRSTSPMNSSRNTTMTPPPPPAPYYTSASIEELLDSPSESPKIKAEDVQDPNSQMLNLINNTNASADTTHNGMGSAQNNLEVLSNEISNTGSPLTPSQCNHMLQMMAKQAPGSSSSLISPSPPLIPHIDLLKQEANELQQLSAMQNNIDASLNEVAQAIQPLSPSGMIPGFSDVDGAGFFDANSFMGNGMGGDLEMDQYLDYDPTITDDGAFWNSGVVDGGGGGDFGKANGEDGAAVGAGEERIVEEADTPE